MRFSNTDEMIPREKEDFPVQNVVEEMTTLTEPINRGVRGKIALFCNGQRLVRTWFHQS